MTCSAVAEHVQWTVNIVLGLPALAIIVYATVNAAFMNYRRTTD